MTEGVSPKKPIVDLNIIDLFYMTGWIFSEIEEEDLQDLYQLEPDFFR